MNKIECPKCHKEMIEVESDTLIRAFVCDSCGNEIHPIIRDGEVIE